jgi:quinoprotein glucose dehydrogenase
MRKFVLSLVVVGAAVSTLVAQSRPRPATRPKPYTTWTEYLGSSDSSAYTALDQINKNTVSNLQIAWTYPTGNRQYTFNPLVINDVMYVLAKSNDLVALDAATGKELWDHPNMGPVGARGMNYWRSADGTDGRLFYINAGYLTSVDAKTGETITTFGQNGRVDLRLALDRDTSKIQPLQTSNPGRIYQNLIIVSLPAQGAGYESTPGDVQAYDVHSGKLVWVFHSIPRPGEFGADTWPAGMTATAGGVHNWSEFTVDQENGIVFVPFGTARYDFFGGNRQGANLFANSLVALDAKTGKRLWHYQIVHHDLWDYDLPQAPKLLTIHQNGKAIDVVAQATKHGFLFVFDRKTGKPIWPIEERPVPKSDLPGEHAWPTQPFPTKPKPFARQSFTEKDINPYLPPDEQDAIRQKLRSYRNEGLFTPPSLQGTVEIPGHNGGANWGSSSVDPIKGELYIVDKESPTVLKVIPGDVASAMGTAPRGETPPPNPPPPDYKGRYRSPIDFWLTSLRLSALGPPWSTLTAYDLNTGEIKWQVPNGTVSNLPPIDAWKGNTGAQWPRGGILVTGGGLLFVATGSDRTLRAYDRDTGKVLWSTELPAASDGMPASYEVDGRQMIVVPVASGLGSNAVRVDGKTLPAGPGSYITFALPTPARTTN